MSEYEELNAKAYIQGLKDGKEIGRADAIEEFCNRIEQRFDEAREQGIEIDMCNIDIIRRDMENERI